ncbi:MAG TPA: hypothetical protein DEB37_14980 [Lysinibacillus sp.]|uniref:hypothetical protein n=1 Tax=Lysinibacillus TaxID=400634 RepID=UPI00056B7B7A|nr:hypothetical protein [Lysinibacillus sphaericus]HBT73496.1 hypothetical protein [Lysinibacillus sp.]
MKKVKLFVGILATSTFLFSGAIVPSAQASQPSATSNAQIQGNIITPYKGENVSRSISFEGRIIPPTFLDYGSRGRLMLGNWYYIESENRTVAHYTGWLIHP